MEQLKLPFDFSKSDAHWYRKLLLELTEQHGYLSTVDLNSIAKAIIEDAEEEYEKY